MRQILVAYEADHAVEFPVGRGFQLVGDVGDAVGVVAVSQTVSGDSASVCQRPIRAVLAAAQRMPSR